MKKRTLNDGDKSLLVHCLKEHAPDLISEIDHLDQLDIDTIERMREAIGDELIAKGFNGFDEKTEYGSKVDDLMERFAALYYWPRLEN